MQTALPHITFIIIFYSLISLSKTLNEVLEIPGVIIFDIINEVLRYLLSIDLYGSFIRDILLDDLLIVRVVILCKHNLFLLPFPLFLLVFLPLLLSKLFLVQWIVIVLLSEHLATIVTSRHIPR